MGLPRFSRGSCCLLSRLPAKLGSPETRSRPRGFLRLYSRHFSAWGERWFAGMPRAVSTRQDDESTREMWKENGERKRKMEDRERETAHYSEVQQHFRTLAHAHGDR